MFLLDSYGTFRRFLVGIPQGCGGSSSPLWDDTLHHFVGHSISQATCLESRLLLWQSLPMQNRNPRVPCHHADDLLGELNPLRPDVLKRLFHCHDCKKETGRPTKYPKHTNRNGSIAVPTSQLKLPTTRTRYTNAQVRIPFPRSLCLRMHLGETPQNTTGPKKHQTPNHQRKSCWNKHLNI